MSTDSIEIVSALADLSGLTLAALGKCDEVSLAPSMVPFLQQIDVPTNSVGGHNS